MKNPLLIISLLLLKLSVSMGQTGPILKPLISEKFEKVYMSENFDSTSAAWSTLASNDNLFLMQGGEYILNRKSNVSPFAVMGNLNTSLSGFRIITSLKLIKTATPEGSIGIIFMAQKGGQGGFIFEVNANQQYRLRQINGTTYKYLTGTAKDGGWIKTLNVKSINLSNLVDIRTFNKDYDIYLNGKHVFSFNEIIYKSGDIGLLIGPACKGSVDYIHLFTNEIAKEEIQSDKSAINNPENDMLVLTESIINLKTQLNKINSENEDLKAIIEDYKVANEEAKKATADSKQTIKSLDFEINKLELKLDTINKINAELLKYKELVQGNDSGDLVISLSKSLKNEKLKNDELVKEIKALKDSLNSISKNHSSAGNSTNENPVNTNDTNSKEFVLPKEN